MKKLHILLRLCLFSSTFLFFTACQKSNNLIEDNLGDGVEEVVIISIDNISWGSAKIKVNNHFSAVKEMGFVWSDTQIEPTLADMRFSAKTVNKTFTESILCFAPETIYYMRAYVIQKDKIIYSKSQVFETLKKPAPKVVED
jgi:hypothetical protein